MELDDLFKFDKFVAPILIRGLYWVGIVIIVLFTLISIFGMNFTGSIERIVFTVVQALLVLFSGALFIVLWRIVCELWLAIFKINERVGILAGQDKKEP
jgi:hypothetical protein